MRSLLACLVLLTAAGASARDKAPRLDVGMLAATGEARRCLLSREIRSWRTVGQRWLMVEAGKGWYRSEIPGGCPGLGQNRILERRNTVGLTCKGDQFGIFDPLTRLDYGLCGIGEWVPVTVPKGARF